MSRFGRHPPPRSSFQLDYQEHPEASSFEPDLWSCQEETLSEPNLDHSLGYSNNQKETASFGYQPTWEDYGPHASYGGYGPQWHQGGGPHRWRRRRTKKKRILHICEPCDRAFKSNESYYEHMSKHVKCPVPGCDFMGYEKVVNMHQKCQHDPESKIKLDTSEDIEKWREERRKNYPTRGNVVKKLKTKEETSQSSTKPCSETCTQQSTETKKR